MTSRRETQMGDQVIFISYPLKFDLVLVAINRHQIRTGVPIAPDYMPSHVRGFVVNTHKDVLTCNKRNQHLFDRKKCIWILTNINAWASRDNSDGSVSSEPSLLTHKVVRYNELNQHMVRMRFLTERNVNLDTYTNVGSD